MPNFGVISSLREGSIVEMKSGVITAIGTPPAPAVDDTPLVYGRISWLDTDTVFDQSVRAHGRGVLHFRVDGGGDRTYEVVFDREDADEQPRCSDEIEFRVLPRPANVDDGILTVTDVRVLKRGCTTGPRLVVRVVHDSTPEHRIVRVHMRGVLLPRALVTFTQWSTAHGATLTPEYEVVDRLRVGSVVKWDNRERLVELHAGPSETIPFTRHRVTRVDRCDMPCAFPYVRFWVEDMPDEELDLAYIHLADETGTEGDVEQHNTRILVDTLKVGDEIEFQLIPRAAAYDSDPRRRDIADARLVTVA
jgi:hypothetical protein